MRGKIAPSLMCLDLMNVERDVCRLEAAGVDYFHVDIMDNHFVPNLMLSGEFIKALKKITRTPIDTHLMLENPEKSLTNYDVLDGEDIICIHYESTANIWRAVSIIKEMGVKTGISINPGTPVSLLEELIPQLDVILIMTVNPGFAGQKLIPETVKKIGKLRQMLSKYGNDRVMIEVDGNVSFEHIPEMRREGADIFVGGTSSIFSKQGTLIENTRRMRKLVEKEDEYETSVSN